MCNSTMSPHASRPPRLQHVSPLMFSSAHYQGCIKAEDSARPWMRAAEVAATPLRVLPYPCALCSLCSVCLRCISLSSHRHKRRAAVCVREKLLAQKAPGSQLSPPNGFVQAGSNRTQWVLFFFSRGSYEAFAMRWT